MSDRIKKYFWTDRPEKKCANCGNQFEIPQRLYKEGFGYPRIWTPFCPDCQKTIDAEIERAEIDKIHGKEKKEFEWRKNNIAEYLMSINIPYPTQEELYGLDKYVNEIAELVIANEWIIFAGTAGGGKTYLASMVMRKLALMEQLYHRKMAYKSLLHLLGEIRQLWDEEGFNTGEELIAQCINADILMLELNNTQTSRQMTAYVNEVLFKILDQRYMKMKRNEFCPTILITVTGKGQMLYNSFKENGIDDANIGRILEMCSSNVYKFNDKDFRKERAMEIKRVTNVR